MHRGTVFENNRTQAVRLPVDVRFSDDVKKVLVRKRGKERILTPIDHAWDSFFLAEDGVTD
jgi:antitoxin VapB